MNEPIDTLHADCIAARSEIRRNYQEARERLGLNTQEEPNDTRAS